MKLCTFDEIEAEEVRWLWKPYIAFGKLTVLQGDPGNGKTTLALALAAFVSQGRRMPTGSAKAVGGNVIFQSGEDSPKDTIKPRLEACKADCSKIAFMETDCGMDVKMLEEAVVEMNAKLVVIDPLQAFISANHDISSTKNMRPLLRDLGGVAERTGAAVIIIGHMNKNDRTKGIYRGLGSIDITAAARSVLLIGKIRGNENIRFMAQIKNNLTAFGKAVSFIINKRGGVEFHGECDISGEELLSTTEVKMSKYQIARETITAMLSGGDVKSNAVFDACIKAGVSASTMSYVKKQLGIQSVKKIDDWYWTLTPGESDFAGCSPAETAEDSDETPVMFVDEFKLPEKPLNVPESNNQHIAPVTPDFSDLELLDWRNAVI